MATAHRQRILPRLRIRTGDHGIVGAARFYSDVFRPFEEAGLELGSTGVGTEGAAGAAGTEGAAGVGVDVTVAGFRLRLTDAADTPQAAPVTPATNIMLNVDPVFFGWDAAGESEEGEADRRAACSRARAVLDTVWDGLAEDGDVLMPLDGYPFSARYGWVQDRFGVSWQLMLTDPAGEPRPPVIPSFMFCGDAQNRAEEALDSWIRTFSGVSEATASGNRVTYGRPTGPAMPESVVFSDARLAGTWVTAMDSGVAQPFTFTDGITFVVECDTPVQAEVLRRNLGLDGHGTDAFGVSWDVVTAHL